MIIAISGGRNTGKTFYMKRFLTGLYLPGDWVRLSETARFHIAMQKIREITITAFEPVAEQLREMANNFQQIEILKAAEQAAQPGELSSLEEAYEKYYPQEPLPRPHKIIPAFNVYHAYKGRLNHKPVYYHIRNNC